MITPVLFTFPLKLCCCSQIKLISVSFCTLRLSEYKQTSTVDEDDDVAAERQRIYEGGSKTDILQIRDLSKVKKKQKKSLTQKHL